MARCPFCGEEIDEVYIYTIAVFAAKIKDNKLIPERTPLDTPEELAAQTKFVMCPECTSALPLDFYEAEAFLKGELVLALPDECTRKGDFVAYRDEVYRVIGEEENVSGETVLLLKKLSDETIAAIVKASLT